MSSDMKTAHPSIRNAQTATSERGREGKGGHDPGYNLYGRRRIDRNWASIVGRLACKDTPF